MLACLHIYSPFCRSETPPPPAAAHVLYVVRSSIQSASGHVGVDALRHAWRDCAKESHYHSLLACVGCSHEVKRVPDDDAFFSAGK